MSPTSFFYFIIIYIIAFGTAYIIQFKYKNQDTSSRYETIDGLRGFLALGVFIHHSTLWYQYIHLGTWSTISSNLYNQFGGTSVSFFFMITSFLFISKLLNACESGYNWNHFFISRVFRLFPLYYLSLVLIILVVLKESNWELNIGLYQFLSQIKHWVFFTLLSEPDINHIKDSYIINAGVAWSLPYEWLFYFALPLISVLIFKKHQKMIYLLIGLFFIVFFFLKRGVADNDYFLFSFVGGAIAPILLKYTTFYRKLNDTIGSFMIVISLLLIISFNSATNIYCILLSSVIFTLIALGNSMFGVLKLPFVRMLGDISYSTYLLHGIVLFSVFHFVIGINTLKTLTPELYSLLVFAIVPVVIILSFVSYKYIEKPGMEIGKRIIDLSKKSNALEN